MTGFKDLHYEFDPELLAKSPVHPRSAAKMMVFDRKEQKIHHRIFSDLPNFLDKGDLLVVNQSQVLKARFLAHKKTGAKLEGLYLKSDIEGQSVWVWMKGSLEIGDAIQLINGDEIKVLEKSEKDIRLGIQPQKFITYLEIYGLVPLPPYIRKARKDRNQTETTDQDERDYQSLWSKKSEHGTSVAAPTASLHFDEKLLSDLERKGIRTAKLDLFVGAGTFEPLTQEKWESKRLHSENYSISFETWKEIEEAKTRKKRVVCVGTTSLRAVESFALLGQKSDYFGRLCTTDLFVYSPYDFKIADALITNFHWPESSLLALVAAFVGENGISWKELYLSALNARYRLFSYGDGMLIL